MDRQSQTKTLEGKDSQSAQHCRLRLIAGSLDTGTLYTLQINVILWHTYVRADAHTHKQFIYLSDPGVRATAVSSRGMHPPSSFRKQQCQMKTCPTGTFLPEGALLVLDTPAAFKSWVGLQAHPTAVSQCSALVQVCCKEFRKKETNICHIFLISG